MAYDQASSTHALAFRVMRLSKPSITVNPCPMRLDLYADMTVDNAKDLASTTQSTPDAAMDAAQPHPYESRIQLGTPSQGFGCEGVLLLPQSFGSIHLGEVRCFQGAATQRHTKTCVVMHILMHIHPTTDIHKLHQCGQLCRGSSIICRYQGIHTYPRAHMHDTSSSSSTSTSSSLSPPPHTQKHRRNCKQSVRKPSSMILRAHH